MPTATAKAAQPTAKVQTTTITKKISDETEIVDLQPAPGLPEVSEDFWKYIESLTAEDWKKHHVSLYRYPLGQTKPQKVGRYVRTYKTETPLVSEDQVFEEFGGGQYDALLRGPAKDGSGRVTLIAKHSWEMDGPPKNPWQVSTASPATPTVPSELASTLQVVLQNLKQAEKSPSAAESPAIKESISLIQQLTTAMPKPQGVGELVSALADLKKLTGGDGGGGNSLVEAVKLLKDLGVIGGERRSLASEIKEIMEIAGMMNGGGGAPASGGRQHWATSLVQTLPTILEKVTPIADKFADAARSNARVAELRTGAIPAPPPPARPSPATALPPAAPAAAVAPAAESPAPRTVAMPETEPAGSPAAAPSFVPPNLEWVKARAVQLFQGGKTGDAIAEWLDSLDDELGNFLGSMSREQFAEFVKSDLILRQISTAARFDQFVEEFVDYFAPPGSDDSGTPAKL